MGSSKPYVTADGRVPSTILWSPELKDSLRKEAAARNADRKQSGLTLTDREWGISTVSEDILRQALGVGNE